MELSEIASIAGKGGLYKITKPTRSGVIVETLDEKKQKMVASADNRISILKEISIYTTDQEGPTPLENVLRKIHEEFEGDPGVSSSSSPDELKAFMKHIVPEYDMSRVYNSDIKKLVSWYNILYKQVPEIFDAKQDEPSAAEEKTKAEGSSDTEKPAKEKKKANAADEVKGTSEKKPAKKEKSEQKAK